ncbi:hypothetical protein LGQ02_12885 [Bacillus shivajii]|uniref:hypothetical protein n=1 Tax=Bacillus shivajii TaxID=1983719 RepID=UPI001CF95E52|nr:hypothetical protein [Bacillus shivajii]UCZ51756.1 hypothetical protein LGQ02_12885 [Bacillus shivajii]
MKLTFSIVLAVMIAVMVHGTKLSLLAAHVIEGLPLIIFYFILPGAVFVLLQFLLYNET